MPGLGNENKERGMKRKWKTILEGLKKEKEKTD